MPSEKISKLSGNDIATQSFVAQDPYIKRANIFFRNTDGAATKGIITVSVIDKKGKKVCSSSLKAGLVNNDSMTMFDFTDDSEELNQNRLIKPELRGHPLDDRGIRMLAHQDSDRIAGYDPQHDKYHQRAPEQNQNGLQKALQCVVQHVAPPLILPDSRFDPAVLF